MEFEAELVALGGLLHDIGKFVQRAGTAREKHTDQGEKFLREFVEKYLRRYDKLPLFAKYHHKEELRKFKGDVRLRNLLHIVYEADNISSGERRAEDEIKFDIGSPLLSVFSLVNILKGDSEKKYYPLTEFSGFFYPVKYKENTANDYSKLFKGFKEEFEKAVQNLNFNVLMYVLEKYTTFIPSMLTENNDISLYDHLKTTSAIGLCMYYYHRDELDVNLRKRIEDRNEKKYLIVGGDVSGIQDFIYTITSKGALKYLRARSLFLELLVEDVVAEIVDRLNLTRANVLFAGGGRFYILAPNTEEAKREIDEIRVQVNKWLFENFREKLYFSVDFVEVNGNELSKFRAGERSLWELVNVKLRERKSRKFLDVITEDDLVELRTLDSEYYEECEVCKTPAPLEEVEGVRMCPVCREFLKLGGLIPKSIGFARVPKDFSLNYRYELPFSCFIPLEDFSKLPEESVIYLRGFDVNTASLLRKYDVVPLNVSTYYAGKEGSIKEFDELAEEATGAKKLAVLRMDVDDLGKIFGCGLRGGVETISRVSTLSRLLSHFFKNCVDLICMGKVDSEFPVINKSNRKNREVVVVYSGGDDLFIVGAWDHIFELAFEIEHAFRKYVGGNPNITVSAGYGIFDPKFPLYRMAEITGSREKMAKEEGEEVGKLECGTEAVTVKSKSRIFLLDRSARSVNEMCEKDSVKLKKSYTWDEFRNIWNEYISKIYDSDKAELRVRRGIIRKILDARQEYLRNPGGFKWQVLLVYYLSRAAYNGNGRKLIDEVGKLANRDVERIREKRPQDIYYVDVPLKIVDFAVRR